MSIKQPIYHEFDLNATSGNSRVISLTHTDDAHVDVIELCVKQNGSTVDLTGSTVIARMVLHKTPPVLLSDSVTCTINDAGNILIPFDNAAVQTRKGIVKIEVNITRTPDILTLQLPLWVKINGSILDDATVDPHSEGTIPELLKDAADALEEATEALEHAGDYDNLEHKPSINGHTLSDNKTSADLDLQGKLTAGQNISINNGEISASTGIIERYGVQYPIVSNRPWGINGEEFYISENQYALSFSLGRVPLKYNTSGFIADTISNFNGHIAPNQFGIINQLSYAGYLPPNAKGGLIVRLLIQDIKYADIILATDCNLYVRIFNSSDQTVPVWTKLGGSSQLVSGVVNQNGTITFTDSGGNTFTTTGSSVIGADGFSPTATVTQTASGATVSITDSTGTTTANISNGADGQDYVLTAQDKSDIADIVLSELPNADTMSF